MVPKFRVLAWNYLVELTTQRRRPRIPARKKGKSPYGKLTGCSGGLNLNPASIGSAKSTDWFDRRRYFSRICTLLVPYATSTVQVPLKSYMYFKFSIRVLEYPGTVRYGGTQATY